MTAPLLPLENDLDARTFPFMDLATQTDDQGFDVCEDDGRRCGLGEDGAQRFSLLGVHLCNASKKR